jgi:hypothetical protein
MPIVNQQDSQPTLPRLEDPTAIAHLVELMVKFGWPPPESSWPDDLDADQLEAAA